MKFNDVLCATFFYVGCSEHCELCLWHRYSVFDTGNVLGVCDTITVSLKQVQCLWHRYSVNVTNRQWLTCWEFAPPPFRSLPGTWVVLERFFHTGYNLCKASYSLPYTEHTLEEKQNTSLCMHWKQITNCCLTMCSIFGLSLTILKKLTRSENVIIYTNLPHWRDIWKLADYQTKSIYCSTESILPSSFVLFTTFQLTKMLLQNRYTFTKTDNTT